MEYIEKECWKKRLGNIDYWTEKRVAGREIMGGEGDWSDL